MRIHGVVITNAERLALAGFLAGYTGLTRDARQGRPAKRASPSS
jgi:hypothetical protein